MLVLIFRMVSDQTNIDGEKAIHLVFQFSSPFVSNFLLVPGIPGTDLCIVCIVLTLDNTSAFPNSSLTHCQYPESSVVSVPLFFLSFLSPILVPCSCHCLDKYRGEERVIHVVFHLSCPFLSSVTNFFGHLFIDKLFSLSHTSAAVWSKISNILSGR